MTDGPDRIYRRIFIVLIMNSGGGDDRSTREGNLLMIASKDDDKLEVCWSLPTLLQYLTPKEWCIIESLSKFHRQLILQWFQIQDTNWESSTKSIAFTPKQRVCRFYQAQKYLAAVEGDEEAWQGSVTEDSEEDETAPSSQVATASTNVRWSSRRPFQVDLTSEYFIQITYHYYHHRKDDSSNKNNHDADTTNSSNRVIIWNGFVRTSAFGGTNNTSSLSLDAIQDHINRLKNSNETKKEDNLENETTSQDRCHWKEWIDLLDYIDDSISTTKINDDENHGYCCRCWMTPTTSSPPQNPQQQQQQQQQQPCSSFCGWKDKVQAFQQRYDI